VGNALAAQEHSRGHHSACHRAEAGQGRADGAFGRNSGATGGQGGDYALLKLPSGETRKVLADCMATIGQVGNTDHENVAIARRDATAGWASGRPIAA